MMAGKAVIDCGATKSIGGMQALQFLGQSLENPASAIVDTSDRPWFTFGNGQRKQVSSRVTFPITTGQNPGSTQIYALDAPNVQILISVESLCRVGAWIDFETGTAVFRKVAPDLVIPLEKSPNGHLLLNLSQDILDQGTPMSEAQSPWNAVRCPLSE